MNRPKRLTIVGVAVAVAVLGGAVVIARTVFGCTPPRDQAEMVELFEDDPLFAVAPEDGQLVDAHAHTYTCDSGLPHGSSPTSPGFVEVMRLYTTPAAYDLDHLGQRFDQPATAAGWRIDTERSGMFGSLIYCKQAAGRASHAYVSSTSYTEQIEDPSLPAVKVILSASPEAGTRCFLD